MLSPFISNPPYTAITTSSSSAPVRRGKKPINLPKNMSITRPIRPVPRKVRLEELPAISSLKFYSSFDLTLENIMWHDRTTPAQIVLENRPRWMRASATFDKTCVHTLYLHGLFLQCPTNNWRPVTRSMVISFRNAIQHAPPGVAACISVYFEQDIDLMNEMVGDDEEAGEDDSATITSQDSELNETMFLFRFYTNTDARHRRFEPTYDQEYVAGSKSVLDMINLTIDAYDLETVFMEGVQTEEVIEV